MVLPALAFLGNPAFYSGIGNVASAGGVLSGLFGKKKKTTVGDIRTPEQKAAQAFLQQLAMGGSAGGINLGEAYGGSLGNYDMTSGEQNAQSQLAGLFGGQDMTNARNTFTDLANTKFDPSDPKSGYAAYSRALAKEQQGANDVINREGAITGSRFGTGILNTKQDMAENFQNQRAMKLAELFQNSRSQQLAGAQGLQGLVGTQANLANQQAAMAGLERELKNQQAQVQYSEFQRQRGETLSRIDLMNKEASRNPYLGIPSITTTEQSPWSSLTNSVLGGFGTQLGTSMGSGGGLMDLFKGLFNKGGSTGGFTSVSNGFSGSGTGFSGGSLLGG
jgi:hypothetical protein